jgi:hypothetical protein
MRGLGIALLALSSACVIDAQHVRTELVKVCTTDVPLLLVAESPQLSVATIAVDGIGATVDHPDARASLSSLTIVLTDASRDFGFADSVSLDLISLGAGLPAARVAEGPSTGVSPWTVSGDPAIDLVAYLTSEALEMRLEIRGESPADAPGMLFSACLDVEGIEIEDD